MLGESGGLHRVDYTEWSTEAMAHAEANNHFKLMDRLARGLQWCEWMMWGLTSWDEGN